MTSDVSRDGAWPRPRLWAGAAALVLVVVGACGGPDRSTDDDRSTVTTTVPQPSTTGSISADPAGPEPPPATGEECLAPADDADQAWFGPGRRLGGYVIGSGSRWVVLGHQSDGTSCQMLPIGRQLVRAGYRVIAIDFSGRGSSVQSDADHALSADVVANITDPSFAYPTTLAQCGTDRIQVVNSQLDQAEGGDPELPFTVSDVPVDIS